MSKILTSFDGGGMGLPAFILATFGASMLPEGNGLAETLVNEGTYCS